MRGRQAQNEIRLPAVILTGSGIRQTRYLLDVDETGGLVIQNETGATLFRIRADGQVDAHLTFNDAGV